MDEAAIHRTLMDGHGEGCGISCAHGQVSVQPAAEYGLFAFVPQGPIATSLVHEVHGAEGVVCIHKPPTAAPKRSQGAIWVVRKMADFAVGRRAFEHLFQPRLSQSPTLDDAVAIPREKHAIGPFVKGKHRGIVPCDFHHTGRTPARETPGGIAHDHASIAPSSEAVASGLGVESGGAVGLVHCPLRHNAIAPAGKPRLVGGTPQDVVNSSLVSLACVDA